MSDWREVQVQARLRREADGTYTFDYLMGTGYPAGNIAENHEELNELLRAVGQRLVSLKGEERQFLKIEDPFAGLPQADFSILDKS